MSDRPLIRTLVYIGLLLFCVGFFAALYGLVRLIAC